MKIHPAPVTEALLYVAGVILLVFKPTVWLGISCLALAWLFAIAVARYYGRGPRNATT